MLRGLRYQRNVETALAAWARTRPGVTLEFGPWFRFQTVTGAWRFCQPDVVIDSGAGTPLVVLEVKLAIEPRAWWQVLDLYCPVVAAATRRDVFAGVICQSFDPAVRKRVPGGFGLAFDSDAEKWLNAISRGESLADDSWPLRELLPTLQWKRPSADAFALKA